MNLKTDPGAAVHNARISDALGDASGAVEALTREGVRVLAAMANGRRPLLMVDRLPADVLSVVKRRSPNGVGGTTVVRATEWHGCQLECLQDEMPAAMRISSCGRPLVEVARG